MENVDHFKLNMNGFHSSIHNKIQVIKAIRELTSMSLYEAKECTERLGEQILVIDIQTKIVNIEEQFRILRNNGCVVGPAVNEILEELRELASQSLKLGEDELANEILQLVLAEKLRRKSI